MEENLFNRESYQNLLQRLHSIDKTTKPKWGKMSAAQMMAHCAEVQEVNNGKEIQSPFLLKLLKPLIIKAVLKGEYKQSEKTHPAYLQTKEKDFEVEKKRLITAMDDFVNEGEKVANEKKHPFFGKMSANEKGRAMYKHLEHHLNQFGV